MQVLQYSTIQYVLYSFRTSQNSRGERITVGLMFLTKSVYEGVSRMDQVGRSVPAYVIIVFRMRSHAEGAICDHRTALQRTVWPTELLKPVKLFEFSLPELRSIYGEGIDY